jgi:hypothetical protein
MMLEVDKSAPTGDGRSGEVEVTSAMLEAGRHALHLCDPGDDHDLLIWMIYTEMERAKLMEAR